MGCVTRIFGVLAGIGIIFAGIWKADRGMFGGNDPRSSLPLILIGAVLLLFTIVVSILGRKRPTAKEILAITIGFISLAIVVGNI